MSVNRNGGRRSKLTPERQELIVAALRDGAYRSLAAQAGGIVYDTFLRWYNKGHKRPLSIYGGFSRAVDAAEAEAELANLRIIRRTAEGFDVIKRTVTRDADNKITGVVATIEQRYDWKAAAWWLARKNPERWAYERKHKVTLSGDSGVIVVSQPMELQEWERIATEQQRALQQSVRDMEKQHGIVH